MIVAEVKQRRGCVSVKLAEIIGSEPDNDTLKPGAEGKVGE